MTENPTTPRRVVGFFNLPVAESKAEMSQKRAEKLLRRGRRKRKKAEWHQRKRFERMVSFAGHIIEAGYVAAVRLREMPPFHNRRSLMVDRPLVQAYHAGRLVEVLRHLAANRLGLHLRRRMGSRDKEPR